MSAFTKPCIYNNTISNYTLEEFTTYLEENEFSSSYFKTLEPSKIETIKDTFIDYNIDIKLLVCSKCKSALKPNLDTIKKHIDVSKSLYYL